MYLFPWNVDTFIGPHMSEWTISSLLAARWAFFGNGMRVSLLAAQCLQKLRLAFGRDKPITELWLTMVWRLDSLIWPNRRCQSITVSIADVAMANAISGVAVSSGDATDAVAEGMITSPLT